MPPSLPPKERRKALREPLDLRLRKPAKAKNFLGKKHIFLSISGLVIVAGIVFMVIHGSSTYPLNYSLDFVGGTSTDVFFNESRTVAELEADVKPQIAEGQDGGLEIARTAQQRAHAG